MGKTILVIAAHPDDEVLGCGGTIARHAAQNDPVHVLVMSRGVLVADEIVETVRREMRGAHAILGVTETHLLEFPAARLDTVPGHELADSIRKVIQAIAPQTLYLPHHGDLHADHRVVYLAGLVAARPIQGCPVKRILAYETVSETEWAPPLAGDAFVPNVFVDVTNQLGKKLKAADCYTSQMQSPPHSRSLRSLEALAMFRGGTISVEAAEAFMLVREIVD